MFWFTSSLVFPRGVQTQLEPENPTKLTDADMIPAGIEAPVGRWRYLPLRTDVGGLSGGFPSLKPEPPNQTNAI